MPTPRDQSRSSDPPRDPLDRLRGLRVRPERARSLGEDLRAQIGSIRKVSATESAAIEAWNIVAPDELTAHCVASEMRAGKLVVLVPNAASRYVAQRWLGGGGLAELQVLARVPIRGVEFRMSATPGSGRNTVGA